MTKKVKSQRFVQRLQLAYRIDNDLLDERISPTSQEINDLFSSVFKNAISKFSLTALSRLDLNSIYSVCFRSNENCEELSIEGSTFCCNFSLLQYAIALGQDTIILAIIRSGAAILNFHSFANMSCSSPDHLATITESQILKLNQSVIRKLKSRPHQNTVWLLRVLSSISSPKPSLNFRDMSNINVTNVKSCVNDYNDGDSLLCFPICQHTTCVVCFWKRFVMLSAHDDIECPICHIPIDNFDLPNTRPKHNRRDRIRLKLQSGISSIKKEQADVIVPVTKDDSYHEWLRLPTLSSSIIQSEAVHSDVNGIKDDEDELSPNSPTSVQPKLPFQALSLTQLAELYIGEVSGSMC